MKREVSVLGIDIAKRVFHAVGIDETGYQHPPKQFEEFLR
jgi:hypothetical protein